MLTRIVSSSDNPPPHQILQNRLLVNTDVKPITNDDGVTSYEYTQIVTDTTCDPDDVLIEYKAGVAQTFLNETDFYFTVDKYQQLSDQKKEELETKREAAREDIRIYEDSQN